MNKTKSQRMKSRNHYRTRKYRRRNQRRIQKQKGGIERMSLSEMRNYNRSLYPQSSVPRLSSSSSSSSPLLNNESSSSPGQSIVEPRISQDVNEAVVSSPSSSSSPPKAISPKSLFMSNNQPEPSSSSSLQEYVPASFRSRTVPRLSLEEGKELSNAQYSSSFSPSKVITDDNEEEPVEPVEPVEPEEEPMPFSSIPQSQPPVQDMDQAMDQDMYGEKPSPESPETPETPEEKIATAEYIINDLKKGFSKVGELTGIKSVMENVKQHPITEQLNNLASTIGTSFRGATHGFRKSLGLTSSPTPMRDYKSMTGGKRGRTYRNKTRKNSKRKMRRTRRI